MIALQESSYRKENRLWLLFASKKNNNNKKRLLTMCARSVRGAFSPFLFLFVSCRFPSEAQDSLVSVLNLIFIFTSDPYHINTLR